MFCNITDKAENDGDSNNTCGSESTKNKQQINKQIEIKK